MIRLCAKPRGGPVRNSENDIVFIYEVGRSLSLSAFIRTGVCCQPHCVTAKALLGVSSELLYHAFDGLIYSVTELRNIVTMKRFPMCFYMLVRDQKRNYFRLSFIIRSNFKRGKYLVLLPLPTLYI